MKSQSKKPRIGTTTKDEKRKARREKLTKTLNARKEAEALEAAKKGAPPPQPVTFGAEFTDILKSIEADHVASSAQSVSKRESVRQAIEQQKAIFSNPAFIANPQVGFDVANNQLEAKILHQQQLQQQQQQQQQQEKK